MLPPFPPCPILCHPCPSVSKNPRTMSFTPYDWNQSIQTRTEYIEERLRDGSPVVGISIPDGLLLVSLHRAERKVYEIYDRLVFGAVGNQSDIETVRNASIDFAHREGFQ